MSNDIENMTAQFPVSAEFMRICSPVEFTIFCMEHFADHAKSEGYELVVDYVRIVVMNSDYVFLGKGTRMVSVTASCRKVT